ncbi:hypothetical protein [Flavobacterium sp. LC2016-12]|uniref:hypothetical protein n=1 Tax=Flavobacterium sp. LC2016-12 TaxID=2783794 RepID=UPI00188B002B|nr:hypothetical protein [Flavobacterium sp. LC2016-12]MBF4465999.1 hypothetical protein [Flavobacterium sp. LC2016-12]
MKKLFPLLMLLVYLISFGQESDENKQLFKTKIKAAVTVNDTINLDNFKELAIIPGGHFRKELEKINYFSKIMTEDEFKKEIKKAGLDNSKYNWETKEGVKNISTDYKKFIFIAQTISNTDKNIRQIIIVDPIKGKVFEVEGKVKTNVIGISAGTKYLPQDMNNAMLNELVNYIRANSKSYQ